MSERPSDTFLERYGRWALIAGSAEGMGIAYAERFARRGLDLVLLDRDGAGLEAQAKTLKAEHGVGVRAIRCDLADTESVEKILDGLEKLEIGMLVYNAAAADSGPWLEVPLARKNMVVSVNVLTPLALVDRLSRKMAARGRGGIILTSSMSALHGAPLMPPAESEQTVDEALAALGKYPSWIPGRVWRAAAVALTKIVPRRLSIRFTADRMKQFGKS